MNIPEKKKPGRKKKILTTEPQPQPAITTSDVTQPEPQKKRGRKPKSGLSANTTKRLITPVVPQNKNIILTLNCTSNDLKKNENIFISESDYQNNDKIFNIQGDSDNILYNTTYNPIESDACEESKLNKILQELQINLHYNNVVNKKSDCFWCGCGFNNLAVHIITHKISKDYEAQGCFCTPECAAGYIFHGQHNLDKSTKIERYQLLNYIYGGAYEYTQNIIPAPNPHYLLDKYMGTMSIETYRNLGKSNKVLFVVEKPLSRVNPELCVDNFNNSYDKNTLGNLYQVKKKTDNAAQSNSLQGMFLIK